VTKNHYKDYSDRQEKNDHLFLHRPSADLIGDWI